MIYLLVIHRIDPGDGVDSIVTDVRNRAFVTKEGRRRAAIDNMLHLLYRCSSAATMAQLRRAAPTEDIDGHVGDIEHLLRLDDVEGAMSYCSDAFGFSMEFQDIELEFDANEMHGEVVG